MWNIHDGRVYVEVNIYIYIYIIPSYVTNHMVVSSWPTNYTNLFRVLSRTKYVLRTTHNALKIYDTLGIIVAVLHNLL